MERNKTTRNSKMERFRSGEDVSSSDESDPERHMSDNSGSTKPETESNKPETESNLKNVVVLLRRDVHENDGKVYMPKAKEMTQLKMPEKEQYKTGIKLTWNMTEKNVDEELRRRFPILGNNGRLSCATAADKGTRLEFHNSQGKVWDGSKINRLVRGNRVLYVLFEETSESVFERPDSSPQLQTPTNEPMGKKSRKRRNDGSASAAVCKRTKECSATVVSSIGNSSIPMQLCCVNGRQNGPQGHSSTTTTVSQKNISSQNFFLDRLSKATGSQKCAIPVTYTCTRTSSTIGPGHQTQATGGILPPAHPPVSMPSSPYLNFSMQTSVQGYQSQPIVSRAPQRQLCHLVRDDSTVRKDTLIPLQLSNSIPVTNPTELQKQIQTGLDPQYVLQNTNSLPPGTTQDARNSMITLDSGNIWQRSVPAHQTVGSQWGPQASVPSQSQIGQGQSPSTCLVYNQGDNPISQETQTSGTSLTESEILHNDPSKQTAATADLPPISHESDSGLSSTRNNDVGVAIASNSADQSEDTSTLPEIFSSSEDGEEIWFEYQILIPDNTSGVVKKIFPSSGPILEDIPFCITLKLILPRKYRKLQFKANFEGIGAVPLDIETGNATLTGIILSHVAGKVKVNVEYEGSNGNSIGFTFFEFIKKNDLVILAELSEVKLGQSVIYNALMNANGTTESSGSGIQEATLCGAGGTGVSNVTKRSYALPGKTLTLLVYKAAEINDREFLEMVFNTSAGRVVFNYYRKSSTLPGDVARANGHIILGDFLEDVNERLSKEVCSEDSYETVNWLELKHAVEKKVCLPCTDDAQLVSSPDSDDNQSDYEADDEASLLPSPADANANGGELDDSEHGDIGQITSDENDSCDSIATDAERQRNQTETERQAWSGSLFTNRDDSVMEMESSSHSTDNVEIRSNPRVSCTNYSEKSVLNSAQDAVTNVALYPNQEGVDRAEGHFVTSAVMAVAGETSNAIELSSEGGTDSSAERQNQEPTDSVTRVLPCEINLGTLVAPYIQKTTKNTFSKWYCDKRDQKKEEDDLEKPLDHNDAHPSNQAEEEKQGDQHEEEGRKIESLSTDDVLESDHIMADATNEISVIPPRLGITLPKLRDLPVLYTNWNDVQLPIDILLLTLEDNEFLACYHYLDKPFKAYHIDIGLAYFGFMGNSHDNKLKITVMKCSQGCADTGGSFSFVGSAVRVLRPKAVFLVGMCSGIDDRKTKLGDVVVTSKVTTHTHQIPSSRHICKLIKHVADGWNPPLKGSSGREVKVHCGGEVLCKQESLSGDILQKHPEGVAVEIGGEDIYSAVHDLQVEWILVKGIKDHINGDQSSHDNWGVFASVMAASVVANILHDPVIFKDWCHSGEVENGHTWQDATQDYTVSPPRLTFALPKIRDLPVKCTKWNDVQLPIDVLLWTLEDNEFLACYHYLDKPFKAYHRDIGFAFFGFMSNSHESKLKITVMKCSQSCGDTGGRFSFVGSAVRVLRPKAVFLVGACSGLDCKETKLGDVVVPSKVTTQTHQIPSGKHICKLIRHVADGWNPPLKDPNGREVKVHCGGEVLCKLEALTEDIVLKHPQGIAVENGGEGFYSAVHDSQVEWILVKGIKDHINGVQSSHDTWEVFASVMAASVVANILHDPMIFKDWCHYGEGKRICSLSQTSQKDDVGMLSDRRIAEPRDTSWTTPHTSHSVGSSVNGKIGWLPYLKSWILFGMVILWNLLSGNGLGSVKIGMPQQEPIPKQAISAHAPCQESVDDVDLKVQSGYVLVIHNYIFPKREEAVRHGSEEDVKNLCSLFDDFNFKTQIVENLTQSQMVEILSATSEKDFSRYDCFLCVILSHGFSGGIYGIHDDVITIEAITSNFRRDACPSLEGKPKIFLIQACRGNRQDRVTIECDSEPVPCASSSLPADADFLICFASAPGHQSYRQPELGSWFISTVVAIFKEYAEREHLMDMMSRVNNHVANYSSKTGFKQIPSQVCMLRRKVYFCPKYNTS